MFIPIKSGILAALPLSILLAVACVSSAQAQSPAGVGGPPAQAGTGGPPTQAEQNRGGGRQAIETGPGSFKGIVTSEKSIYYEGDTLDIRVKFPRGGDLLAAGEADAHIVIYSRDRTVTAVPVASNIGSQERRFFSIDNINIATLPEGQYQLGLVVTVPAGDPLLLADWYSGFRGLLHTKSIYVSAESLQGDANRDGEWDDDEDRDGISENPRDTAAMRAANRR
jgi:hypothetical protein